MNLLEEVETQSYLENRGIGKEISKRMQVHRLPRNLEKVDRVMLAKMSLEATNTICWAGRKQCYNDIPQKITLPKITITLK